MIKVVIIEDEAPARRKLKRFLADLSDPVLVVAELTNIAQSIEYLENTKEIDLILSDIELLDGNAFNIFREVQLSTPIIFTTAYDQFYMDAFESNGIEYLLKPFSFERFKKAWNKFLLLRGDKRDNLEIMNKIGELLSQQNAGIPEFKKRFSVSSGRKMYFIDTEEVLYFSAEEGVVLAVDIKLKNHILSYPTLKEIEIMVDPYEFYRINRSQLVNKKFIEQIQRYSKNTVAVKLKGLEKLMLTSQSNTATFRQWIEL